MGEADECPGSTLRLYLQAAIKTAQTLLRAMASPSHVEKGGLLACIKWVGFRSIKVLGHASDRRCGRMTGYAE